MKARIERIQAHIKYQ